MGVYSRYKREPNGFRAIVELIESTPAARREKMIKLGMEEDPVYTEQILHYAYTFEDVIHFSDLELAELMVKVPPRTTAYALMGQEQAVIDRFIRNSKPPVGADIKNYLSVKIGPMECGGARLKMISIARELERNGLIRTKQIPMLIPSRS